VPFSGWQKRTDNEANSSSYGTQMSAGCLFTGTPYFFLVQE